MTSLHAVLHHCAQCRHAGIRVMVITGDNKKTAEAICQSIGVFGPKESLDQKSFTGREFVEKPKSEQIQILQTVRGCVFSRAEPKHKQVRVFCLLCVGLCLCVRKERAGLCFGVGSGGGGAWGRPVV